MNIRILQLLAGAQQAEGLTVIIDVFRASTVGCYVFGNGAERILPVAKLEAAYELKEQNPDFLLIGERKGQRPPNFDFGNSPTEIENVDFTGKTLVQTTSAGTQGIVNAQRAEEIIIGSFVNAPAIVAYIRSRRPAQVSLVCMGTEAVLPADEDTLCAQFIKDSLECRPTDFEQVRTYLRGYQTARKFFDVEKVWAPERDFDLCLSLGRFNFILKAHREANNQIVLRKVNVAP